MATEEVPKFSGHHDNGNAPPLLQTAPNHLQSQNPSINPNSNPTNRITFNGDVQHRPPHKNERAMEKFRDVVMKMAKISERSTTPTVAAAQKDLIEQRLSDFFSNFHTPNHPPYAAMIQRAIQELNENGGSSEESISNYIKKEYNDLPWAHCTLLKHHLSKLCDYGEISVTRKRSYLLAGAKPCSNAYARPKRENLKRKRRSQSGRGRSRCRKKEETVEDDEQNGKQNREVIEKDEVIQKENEPKKEKVKLAQQSGRGRSRCRQKEETEEDDQQNGKHNREVIEKDEVIQKENEPKNEKVKLAEEQNLALALPNELIEQSECHQQQNEVILDLGEQENAVMQDEACELENGLIEGKSQLQNQESEARQSQPWCPMVPSATLDLYPVPIQQQRPELSYGETAEEFEEVMVEQLSETDNPCQSLHEPKQAAASTTGELLPSSHSKDQHQLQTELPNPERNEELKQTLVDKEVLEYEAQELEKSLIQGQSKQQQEDSGVGAEWSPPNPEGPAELGGLPKSESTLKTALTLPLNVDLLEKEQDGELPNSETKLVEQSKAVEFLNRQKQQAERDKFQPEGTEKQDVPINSEADESEPGTVVSCIDLHMDPKKIDEEWQPDISFAERPTELERVTVEQSCKTDRQQRQQRRWRQSLHKVKPAPTSMRFHSQDQHALEAKQPNTKRPQGLKQAPMENEVIGDEAHVLENSLIEGKSQQQKQKGAQSRPNPVIPSEVELTAVTELSPMLHQTREEQRPKRQLGSQGRSHSVHNSATFVELRQQADISGLYEAEGAEPGSIIASSEQSSDTDRGQRQLRRWTRSPHRPKQAGELLSLHSCDEHPIQTEIPNPEGQELKENPVEQSTQITVQRVKLRSWQKQNTSQSNTVKYSLNSDLPSKKLELQPKPNLPHPERTAVVEPIEELSPQLQKATQKKLLQGRLRPRPPKSEPKPSDDQHEEEQQPVCVGQEQPPEPKSDTPVKESTRTDLQNPRVPEQPARRGCGRGRGRGRGRPPKPKHEGPVGEPARTDHQVYQQLARRGRGRPRKRKSDMLVGELTGTDHQNPSVQEEPACDAPVGESTEHQNSDKQGQPPLRGSGRGRGRGHPRKRGRRKP